MEKSLTEISELKKKYVDRIPVIISYDRSWTSKKLDKNKFLVPRYMTVGEFLIVLRRQFKLDSTESIYIIHDKKMLISTTCMIDLEGYDYLNFVLNKEVAFG